MSIHPTAVISAKAALGESVSVGPFAVIDEDVRIGDGSMIGAHAVIHRYTTLGPECRVHAGAVLGDLPQDLSFQGATSSVEIGARCVIREGVTIHRGTKEGTATVVGDECFLMAFSHLGHNVRLGNAVILANGVLLAGYVEVGDRVFISGHAGVHQFVRIGRLAMLTGLSGVSKDVPPFCLVGVGRNVIAGLNIVGLKRAGLAPDARKQIKAAFDLLYRSGLNVSQALEQMRKEFPDGPAAELWRFVEASKRGICAFREGAESDAG